MVVIMELVEVEVEHHIMDLTLELVVMALQGL
jgi:hypothetical protein